MEIIVPLLKFQWNLLKKVQSSISQTGSDNGLVPNKQQAIIWMNDALVYESIYASLTLDELKINASNFMLRTAVKCHEYWKKQQEL